LLTEGITEPFFTRATLCWHGYMLWHFHLYVRLSVCHTRALCQNG